MVGENGVKEEILISVAFFDGWSYERRHWFAYVSIFHPTQKKIFQESNKNI
jgi:mannose/fructose/N-acetylgalactosamine-specific phosphotransferase system component IID